MAKNKKAKKPKPQTKRMIAVFEDYCLDRSYYARLAIASNDKHFKGTLPEYGSPYPQECDNRG